MPRRSSASAKGCGASATSSPPGEPRLPGLPRRVAAGRDVHRGLRPGQRLSLRRPVFPRLDGARAQAPCGGAVGARARRAQRADGRRDAGGARARHRLRGEEDELRAARQSARAHPLAPGSAARRRSRPAPACLDPHARAARALARRAARPHRRHPRPPEEMTPWSAPAAGTGREWALVGAAWLAIALCVAAWIFGSAPFVVFSALRFQLDLPLATLVAVALLVLIRTEGFTRVGWSLVAGGVFAVGMLIKPPFAAYLLPPVVWLLVEERSRPALGNAAFAALVAGAVSLPWYGPRLVGMPRQIAFRAVTHAAEEGKPPTLSAVALAFYPTSLPVQLGVLATVLLVAGIVVALMRRQGLVVVAFLAPLALFMLLRNKDLRYTLPLVPAAAALAGLAVAALGPRLRGVALAVLAVVGGLQVSAVAWAVPPPVPLPGLGTPWVLASPPAGGGWRQRDFLRVIVQDRAGRPAMVSVVPNDNYFSVSNFRYYAVRDELPLRFTRPWEGEPLGIDYMILKSGDQGPDFSEAKSRH